MTNLFVFNSRIRVSTDSTTALNLIAERCRLNYDYFIRRRGYTKHEVRSLEYLRPAGEQEGDGTVVAYFPSGWLKKVVTELRRAEEPYELIHRERKPERIDLPILAVPKEPWEHQREAMAAIARHERGIVKVPTRGGKTYIMALSAGEFSVRTVVMVPTKTLLDQEFDQFASVFGEDKVGRLGGGYEERDKEITIATVQTLYSRIDSQEMKEMFLNTGYLIIDEAHHVKHGGYRLQNTYFQVAERFWAYYRIGFSATPGKTNSLERQLLEGVTGPMIFDRDVRDLTERKLLVPALVHMVVIDRPKTPTARERLSQEYGLIVPSGHDLEEFCKSHQVQIPYVPSFGEQLNEKVLTNTNFRRLVKDLALHAAEGHSVLVSTNRVKEGVLTFTDERRSWFIKGAVPLHAKTKNRTQILDDFRAGKFKILVSNLVREGVDIPAVDVLILASAHIVRDTPVIQLAGRVLTAHEGKERSTIIDFFIRDSGKLEQHSRRRLRLYHEQGFDIEILGEEDLRGIRGENSVPSGELAEAEVTNG